MAATCSLCHFPAWSLREEDAVETNFYVTCYSLDSLRESGDEGCVGCKFLSWVWQTVISEAPTQEEIRFIFNTCLEPFWIHIYIGPGNSKLHNIDVFTLYGEPSFKHARVASLLPPSTRLEHNLSRIQTWISACERDHPKCNAPTSYTPLRLLDVGLEDPDMVKLVELASDTTARYAALSHCWGHTRSKHITNTSNLAINMKGIPVSELPKTFRDAIDIARALEVRYLWIDSLCIVQNSESDWAEHVEIMGSIYQYAYITLAAGASDNDEGGFFAVPDAEPHLLELEYDGEVRKVYFRHAIDHIESIWPATEVFPLQKRGWCFQEEHLSRRYLCFGSKEILWECFEDVACSCSIEKGPFNFRLPGYLPAFYGARATRIRMYTDTGDYEHTWRYLISKYARCRLTYPRDKAPALAGLANAFRHRFDLGSYVHGLWTSSLERDLAWTLVAKTDSSVGRFSSEPSWSWMACALGSLRWLELEGKRYYAVHEIIDAERSGNTMRSTSLLLNGTLLAISLQTWAQKGSLEKKRALSWSCRVIEHKDQHYKVLEPDTFGTAPRYSPMPGSFECGDDFYNDATILPMHGEFRGDYKFWSSEEEAQHEFQHLVFAVFGTEDRTQDRAHEREDDFSIAGGIVLRPKKDNNGASAPHGIHQFERIGWLRYSTGVIAEDYVPAGTKTKFIVV